MSYGIQFFGRDFTPVIGTFGDNFMFHSKLTTPNYTDRPNNNANFSDGYTVIVPSGTFPIIFIHSPVGQWRRMGGPVRVNDTTWYVGANSGNRTNPNCQLYVFIPRKGFQTQEGFGLSTYDSQGNLVYTSDSNNKSLSCATHRPEIDYFNAFGFNGSADYFPTEDGRTFTQVGVSKPAWYLPSPYFGFLGGSNFYHLNIRINSNGTFSLGKIRTSTAIVTGQTFQKGISPIGIPFIDGARYD